MSKTLQFKTFCFEMYKAEKGMTGIMTQELFEKYKVFDYLDTFYDVLHTKGHRYIIKDIYYRTFINSWQSGGIRI